MNHRDNKDSLIGNPVDDSIAIDETLPDIDVANFRDNPTDAREQLKFTRNVDYLADNRSCVYRRILRDVLGNGINVIQCCR